jgi:hypothetical protein
MLLNKLTTLFGISPLSKKIMTLSEIKKALEDLSEVKFVLPNGDAVPPHFHVTEVGKVEKHFIDCGGTVRNESVINFQLFTSTDYDHRLSAVKLKSIVERSEKQLRLSDHEIEVEYQGNTIERYHLTFLNGQFHLLGTKTECLAKDNCGIPTEKPRLKLMELPQLSSCCTPDSGCC